MKNRYKYSQFSFSYCSILWCCFTYTSCEFPWESKWSDINGRIGDIEFDPTLDDTTFTTCSSQPLIRQHYMFGAKTYEGEKIAIERLFFDAYQKPEDNNETGLIRIRFVVNCEGRSGYFRMKAMDWQYVEMEFDLNIANQLMEITKALDGWKIMKNKDGKPQDYYQYLIFKLESGELVEIMP